MRADPARRLAFQVCRRVSQGAYSNLALGQALRSGGLDGRGAALATELVYGCARWRGAYDQIIEAASGRELRTMQPAVVDLLRIGVHQVLSMDLANPLAVSSAVDLAEATVGRRVTGLVNAVLRKVARRDLDEWCALLAQGQDELGALAVRHAHPRWVAEAIRDALAAGGRADELAAALAADNRPAAPTLVVRPGLCERDELAGTPTRLSPFGVVSTGDPGRAPAVAEGRAGVQDEGSQLVALALARAAGVERPWLDMCAGPGGKAALLAGLASDAGTWLLAGEPRPARARLVKEALRAYPSGTAQVVVADATVPPWSPGSFAAVMADVPCTGLGALRRRPEARWRRTPADVDQLAAQARRLLAAGLDALAPGGVLAYVTCSPHPAETRAVVADAEAETLDAPSFLPEAPDARLGAHIQLWPHRHGTDAMFLALLRRR